MEERWPCLLGKGGGEREGGDALKAAPSRFRSFAAGAPALVECLCRERIIETCRRVRMTISPLVTQNPSCESACILAGAQRLPRNWIATLVFHVEHIPRNPKFAFHHLAGIAGSWCLRLHPDRMPFSRQGQFGSWFGQRRRRRRFESAFKLALIRNRIICRRGRLDVAAAITVGTGKVGPWHARDRRVRVSW